jgi:lipoyl(octanoyl) transferase
MKRVAVQRLGLMPYRSAWAHQEQIFQSLIAKKLAGQESDPAGYLLLTEHPSVYTLGKAGKAEHLLLTAPDAELIRINRGGDITFHGPGQLVVYPILDLEQFFTDIKKYMRLLEEVVIRLLASYGLKGERLDGATGVWLDPEDDSRARKICAMGVRSSRWVTMHGLALNVSTDLSYFEKIIPCGIPDKAVTSMQMELGATLSYKEVEDAFLQHFSEVFEVDLSLIE